jgi:release factor glutamine methyltransferase
MGERMITEAQLVALRTAFLRVAKGEPIQYVLGQWPFHNITLKTDKRALIPRPETEQLVERVLHAPIWKRAIDIVDIGTGTGAIILALATADIQKEKHFHAIDLSPEALSLARENAIALGLENRVTFEVADGASTLPPRSVDILVSNPPYISTEETDSLAPLILAHEPRMALDGGKDGLEILRQIIFAGTQVLRPGGELFFEIGDDQGLSIQRLLTQAGYSQVRIYKDFAGHDRYAQATIV